MEKGNISINYLHDDKKIEIEMVWEAAGAR